MCTVLFCPLAYENSRKKKKLQVGRTPQMCLEDEATGNSDTSAAALLLIDVINDLDFEGADEVAPTRHANGAAARSPKVQGLAGSNTDHLRQ
jgi:hypothetical protein